MACFALALRAFAGVALTASGTLGGTRAASHRSLSILRGGSTAGKEVLVTGGVGYIGSHTVLELLRAEYRVVIVDNLCNSNLECLKRVQELAGREASFYEVDIRDKEAMAAVFAAHDVGAVIHFAGLKAVGESVAKPQLYYEVNVQGTLTLLECLRVFETRPAGRATERLLGRAARLGPGLEGGWGDRRRGQPT